MRYSFRLAEILDHVPDPRKRPGTIKAIVEYTGLDRHQVAALLKNEVKYIPLKALSRLCDYLIEHGYAAADELPGALFAVEPENFWELLARRRRLELCVGIRKTDPTEGPENACVIASDAVLLGELLNGVSTLGGTAKHSRRGGSAPIGMLPVAPSPAPHPETLKQTLVWSPGQCPEDEMTARAREVYDDFYESPGDRALICLGSVKSNPVVELIFANLFGGEAFVPQEVDTPKERTCPIYFRFRDNDPTVGTFIGGKKLSRAKSKEVPGIYYEKPDGSWDCVPWKPGESDAALVFYVHRESQGCLEMALCGFSGRATRFLARTLANRAEEFWPPAYAGHGIQVGAFIAQFVTTGSSENGRDMLLTDQVASVNVVSIDPEVFARRLSQMQPINNAPPETAPI